MLNEHRPDEKGIATLDGEVVFRDNPLGTNTDLMKKGLRPTGAHAGQHRFSNEHRPDEKGIATVQECKILPNRGTNEHRPDEKGIATLPPSGLLSTTMNEHRPDEKGIATPYPNTSTLSSYANEHRPDEKGIATPITWVGVRPAR